MTFSGIYVVITFNLLFHMYDNDQVLNKLTVHYISKNQALIS